MGMQPKLRFKGFTDDWEKRKLNEIAKFNPKSTLPDVFEYVDLESVVGTKMINHRTETKTNAPSRAQRVAKFGDVFYQTVRPYQKNNYLFKINGVKYVFSTGYAQLRPKYSSEFLLARIQENMFVRKVLDRSTGTSYPAINSNDLAKIEITIPNSAEQENIGMLFLTLDNLIAVNQRKVDLLKRKKAGYLQKLFPKNGQNNPELRFKGYTDAWEKRQLGEIGQFIRLSVNPQESPNDIFREYSMPAFDNRQTPNVVLGSTMHSNRLKMIDNILLINKLNVRQRRIWLVKKAGENAVSSSEFMPFIPNDVNLEFLKQVFLSDKVTKKLENISSGTSNSQKRITPLDMLDYLLEKPEDVQEQVKIGTLFAHLDTLITVNQRKVDLLKREKKALLQKMFV